MAHQSTSPLSHLISTIQQSDRSAVSRSRCSSIVCVSAIEISATRASFNNIKYWFNIVDCWKADRADYEKYCDCRPSDYNILCSNAIYCTLVITIYTRCHNMTITWATMITDRLHPRSGLHLIASNMQANGPEEFWPKAKYQRNLTLI